MSCRLIGPTCEHESGCLAPPYLDYLCHRHWLLTVGPYRSLDLRGAPARPAARVGDTPVSRSLGDEATVEALSRRTRARLADDAAELRSSIEGTRRSGYRAASAMFRYLDATD